MNNRDIYIRDIDPAVKSKLSAIAQEKNISLNAFCKIILTDYALLPDVRSLNDKYENLFKDMTALYNHSLERNEEALAENTALLRTILDMIRS